MVRSWKDQFHDREVSPVKLNQTRLDLGKIEKKSKPADGQTDRQHNRVTYTCSSTVCLDNFTSHFLKHLFIELIM